MASFVALALAGGMVLGGAVSASADSIQLCKGYAACEALGMTTHGYAANSGKMYWRMYGGHNCTNYAAYMMVRAGMANVRPWTNATGNASGWGVGYAKKTNTTPGVGSVAWWKGGSGHVAYVEAVISPTEIIISEDSWGGDFYWRVIRKSGSGWPDGFIHFKDAAGVGIVPEYRAKPFATTVYTDSSRTRTAVATMMKPGSTAWVEMKFLNTGRSTWSGLQLATQEPNDHASIFAAGWSNPSRAGVQLEAAVKPGNVATFGFPITIPAGLTDGTAITDRFAPVLPDGTRVAYGTSRLNLVADSRSVFTAQPIPVISGTAAQGQTLTASAGTFKPAATGVTFVWKRNGVAIPGATAATYTVGEGDVGRSLTVTTTASAPGVIAVSRTSAATALIASNAPSTIALGDTWVTGQQIISPNGKYRVYLNPSGVLLLQDRVTRVVLWSAKSAGAGATMKLHTTGTFAAYTKAGKLVWSTGSHGKGVTRGMVTDNATFRMETTPGKFAWLVR